MVDRPTTSVAGNFKGWMKYYQENEGLTPYNAIEKAAKSAAVESGYNEEQFNYALDQGATFKDILLQTTDMRDISQLDALTEGLITGGARHGPSALGAWGGMKVGAAIGGAAGAPIAGVGAVPGAVIGGLGGAILGLLGGDLVGAELEELVTDDRPFYPDLGNEAAFQAGRTTSAGLTSMLPAYRMLNMVKEPVKVANTISKEGLTGKTIRPTAKFLAKLSEDVQEKGLPAFLRFESQIIPAMAGASYVTTTIAPDDELLRGSSEIAAGVLNPLRMFSSLARGGKNAIGKAKKVGDIVEDSQKDKARSYLDDYISREYSDSDFKSIDEAVKSPDFIKAFKEAGGDDTNAYLGPIPSKDGKGDLQAVLAHLYRQLPNSKVQGYTDSVNTFYKINRALADTIGEKEGPDAARELVEKIQQTEIQTLLGALYTGNLTKYANLLNKKTEKIKKILGKGFPADSNAAQAEIDRLATELSKAFSETNVQMNEGINKLANQLSNKARMPTANFQQIATDIMNGTTKAYRTSYKDTSRFGSESFNKANELLKEALENTVKGKKLKGKNKLGWVINKEEWKKGAFNEEGADVRRLIGLRTDLLNRANTVKRMQQSGPPVSDGEIVLYDNLITAISKDIEDAARFNPYSSFSGTGAPNKKALQESFFPKNSEEASKNAVIIQNMWKLNKDKNEFFQRSSAGKTQKNLIEKDGYGGSTDAYIDKYFQGGGGQRIAKDFKRFDEVLKDQKEILKGSGVALKDFPVFSDLTENLLTALYMKKVALNPREIKVIAGIPDKGADDLFKGVSDTLVEQLGKQELVDDVFPDFNLKALEDFQKNFSGALKGTALKKHLTKIEKAMKAGDFSKERHFQNQLHLHVTSPESLRTQLEKELQRKYGENILEDKTFFNTFDENKLPNVGPREYSPDIKEKISAAIDSASKRIKNSGKDSQAVGRGLFNHIVGETLSKFDSDKAGAALKARAFLFGKSNDPIIKPFKFDNDSSSIMGKMVEEGLVDEIDSKHLDQILLNLDSAQKQLTALKNSDQIDNPKNNSLLAALSKPLQIVFATLARMFSTGTLQAPAMASSFAKDITTNLPTAWANKALLEILEPKNRKDLSVLLTAEKTGNPTKEVVNAANKFLIRWFGSPTPLAPTILRQAETSEPQPRGKVRERPIPPQTRTRIAPSQPLVGKIDTDQARTYAALNPNDTISPLLSRLG